MAKIYVLEKMRAFSPKVIKSLLGLSLAALSLGLFIELTWELWEKDQKLHSIDQSVLYFFANLRVNILNGPAVDITAIGSPTVCFIVSTIVIAVLWIAKDKIGVVHFLLASAGAGFWTLIIKHLIERGRPTEVDRLIEVAGFSYPSGHTLTATSIYLTLAFLGCRFFSSWKARGVLFFLAMVIFGLVGLSRIYLGVHYPSDALSGAFLGTAWALFLAAIFSHKYQKL